MTMDAFAASGKKTILVVDDTPDNLTLISGLLEDSYEVTVAISAARALTIANSARAPDLILLDVMMPEMDGYEACRRLKGNPATRDIPVIFLTARSDIEDEEKGFELGAGDYIAKPISPPILMARVKAQLAIKANADYLRDKNGFLEAEVARRISEFMAIQDVTIQVMASLAETRDSDTGNHIRRTQFYVRALATQLRQHARFEAFLSEYNINMLFKSAPLHDIGKVGIPDRILLKPGPLEPYEFEIMKSHTTLGRDAIEQAERALGTRVEFLSMAKEIAYSHHEKWDGSGYPAGLRGDEIPISARLMALADVYDALISRRVYKQPMSHEIAVGIIGQGSGRHFDPDVVAAFVDIQAQFRDIAGSYGDRDTDLQQKAEYLALTRPETPCRNAAAGLGAALNEEVQARARLLNLDAGAALALLVRRGLDC
ncbi:MAG TPA: two-component system response regulator [Telluria sp.]|nr:two-component system response regulator [Telluria sp.]